MEISIKTTSVEFFLKVEAALIMRIWAILCLAGYQLSTNAQLQALIGKAVIALYQVAEWLKLLS